MSDDTELNMKGLEQLLKGFKDLPTVRVGILGDKSASRRDNIAKTGKKFKGGDLSVQTNADIGLKHEFGKDGMPIRSFLRMPLTVGLQAALEQSKFFDENALKKVILAGNLNEWFAKIGIVAESVIMDAFDSGGFGKWKPSNMKYKHNQQTLVETQQLRNSITSEVK